MSHEIDGIISLPSFFPQCRHETFFSVRLSAGKYMPKSEKVQSQNVFWSVNKHPGSWHHNHSFRIWHGIFLFSELYKFTSSFNFGYNFFSRSILSLCQYRKHVIIHRDLLDDRKKRKRVRHGEPVMKNFLSILWQTRAFNE